MRSRFAVAALLGALAGMVPPAVEAAVVVLANRSPHAIRFTVSADGEQPQAYAVASGDLVVVPVAGDVFIRFPAGQTERRLALAPSAAYYFADFAAGLDLRQITFSEERPLARPGPAPAPGPGTIAVKILVDDEEPFVRRVWEERLRKRIAAASAVLQRYCQVRLKVVAADTWESDNRLSDFGALLRDFEQKVRPQPARLAIGFTSQRFEAQGRTHLAGIHLPLQAHMLIREWGARGEAERLELLLHELGHYLGAVHSPEPGSVMRPLLADGQALMASFRIGFDPVNTLVMNLVAEEVRTRDVKGLADLSPATRERLLPIYNDMARALPDDPAARRFADLLQKPSVQSLLTGRVEIPGDGVRAVLAAVVQAAERNQRLPASSAASGPRRRTGDRLTEYYFREAAAAARRLPREQAVAAYLLGLAIAVDDSDLLRTNLVLGELWRRLEPEAEQRQRLRVLGAPTMQGRHDWVQHFAVSAGLVVLVGPKTAEAAGIFKELRDSRGGSGFSFGDLSADIAGIAFANRLRAAPALLADLAASFAVADYLPDGSRLREGLSAEEFAKDFGSPSDERFRARQEWLWRRVLELPGHKSARQEGPRPAGAR